ncbi:MAG: ribonuclease R, partial [Methylocystis sp.]
MTKKEHNEKEPRRLPSREDILAFLAREKEAMRKAGGGGKIGKREIARAFGIKGADKIELKRLLGELSAQGAIEKRGKSLAKPGALPA